MNTHTDRPVDVTPTSHVSQKTPLTDVHPPAVAEVVQHSVDTGGSDTSVSSREQTDASSVDSLDMSSAEKPRSRNPARRSRKNPIVAMCHKRKSVTPLSTHADATAAFNKSPEAARRSSAPHNRPTTMRLQLPVPTDSPPSKSPDQQKQLLHETSASGKSPEAPRKTSEPVSRLSPSRLQPPVQAECPQSKSPVQQKRLLHACKSDGDTKCLTENDESQLMSSCGQQPLSAVSCGSGHGGLDEVDSGTREAPQTAPVLLHKADGAKLMLKMNKKIRSCLRFTSKIADRPHPVDGAEDVKVRVVDLSSENVPVTPSALMMTYSELLQRGRSSLQAACLTNRLLLATVNFATGCVLQPGLELG